MRAVTFRDLSKKSSSHMTQVALYCASSVEVFFSVVLLDSSGDVYQLCMHENHHAHWRIAGQAERAYKQLRQPSS